MTTRAAVTRALREEGLIAKGGAPMGATEKAASASPRFVSPVVVDLRDEEAFEPPSVPKSDKIKFGPIGQEFLRYLRGVRYI